jgi:hypothetical protein
MHLECHSMNSGQLCQRTVINMPNRANQLLQNVIRTLHEAMGVALINLIFNFSSQNPYYLLLWKEEILNFMGEGGKYGLSFFHCNSLVHFRVMFSPVSFKKSEGYTSILNHLASKLNLYSILPSTSLS